MRRKDTRRKDRPEDLLRVLLEDHVLGELLGGSRVQLLRVHRELAVLHPHSALKTSEPP